MFKQIKNSTAFFSFLFIFLTQTNYKIPSHKIIAEIGIRNSQSYPWSKKDSWSTHTYDQWLNGIVDWMIKPTNHNKCRQSFQVFEKFCETSPQETYSIIHDITTWDDLTLFVGDSNKQKYVSNYIFPSKTEIGKLQIQYRLATPTDNIEELLERQKITLIYSNDNELMKNQIESLPSTKSEQAILSFWKEIGINRNVEHHCFSMPYIKKLNKSATALLALNTYENIRAVARLTTNSLTSAFLFSYGAIRMTGKKDFSDISFFGSIINPVKKNIKNIFDKWINTDHQAYDDFAEGKSFPWIRLLAQTWRNQDNKIIKTTKWAMDNNKFIASSSFISATYLALNIPNQIKNIKNKFLFDNCLQTIMIYTADYINKMVDTYNIIKNNPTLYSHADFKGLIIFFEETIPKSKELQELFKLLKKLSFTKKNTIFSHKGNSLRAFNLMFENKDSFIPAIQSMGWVDVYTSIAKTYNKSQNTSTPYCKVEYLNTTKPSIEINKFWHPLIDKNNVVTNSITLGINGKRQNIIVTGPNAGGKSTMLKSITLSLISAQSFGFAPAQFMRITPFSLIATYLNITDDIGQGSSLFKAEVKRTDDLLKAISSLPNGKHSFAIFDEIFNGTNPKEGEAIGYSVCKLFGHMKKNICITATHFPLLTQLAETTNSFSNYKVSVSKDKNGKINYPYKIEPGVSNQNVAIDILKNEGFGSQILDEAQSILKK